LQCSSTCSITALDLTLAPFQPARTDYDWLSRDEEVVDAYVADPRCGFGIDPGSAKAMFVGARRLADPAQFATIRSELPVYLAVGEDDPVHGGLSLLTPLAERYTAAGLTDVTVRVYPRSRADRASQLSSAGHRARLRRRGAPDSQDAGARRPIRLTHTVNMEEFGASEGVDRK